MTLFHKGFLVWLAALALTCLAPQAYAQSSAAASDNSQGQTTEAFMATLHPIHGDIKLAQGDAELHLGNKYYFLNAADAKRVITEAWGNPPSNGDGILGMVVAEGSNPIDDWGAIVTYEETFYVTDKDTDKTDYNKMLKQIHDGEAENNAQRHKEGYGTIHLVGWAQQPTYDKVSHTLIWAQDLQMSDTKVDTLNYDVRLLGRKGVLSLNMVDFMPKLPTVREQARDLALAGGFAPGARYEDYKNGDKKAAFGVAGLVAAGLGLAAAKKFGLLAILILVAKKGWLIAVAALSAVKAYWKKLFGKKASATTSSPPLDSNDVISSEGEALRAPDSVEADETSAPEQPK